jgi:hypothetical protein
MATQLLGNTPLNLLTELVSVVVKLVPTGVCLIFGEKPLSLSVHCWRGGVPIEGEQEGEGQPFRGWKG